MKILLTAGDKPPIHYIRMLQRLGAEAVIAGSDQGAKDYAGLLLCGGGDPEPSLYGEKNQGSYGISRGRDRLELSCVHSFLKAGKPILGICRGAQLLNVAFGGSLIQHLPTAELHLAAGREQWHSIRIERPLAELCGGRLRVNSSHHQAVGRLGRGLKAVAFAPDGVVEAVMHERLPVLGLQFHPERMEDGEVFFRWLISGYGQDHPAPSHEGSR